MAVLSQLSHALLGFTIGEPLKRETLANLKKYQYSGVDNSLLSRYVLGHYWSWLVTLFPLWMAYSCGATLCIFYGVGRT